MNRYALLATAVVAFNLIVATLHGLTHAHAEVPLEPLQAVFVQTTVYALPLLAVLLFWTPLRRAGAALLALSMLAALLFGLYFHFVADTYDHVSHRDGTGIGVAFVLTAVLLIPAEAAGAWFGAWSWQGLREPQP